MAIRNQGQHEASAVPTLLYLVYFIYFFCGLTQCFEGVFLPEFKEHFHLNYQQQMYAVFAKNIPFLGAVLMGYSAVRVGYRNLLIISMGLYAVGTALLIPGLRTGRYEIVLLGFLLIGSGFTAQMVAGNPLLSLLGPATDASSRQNLGNALGAVAQIIAPAAISIIIPVSVISVAGKLPYMQLLFFILSVALAATALAVLFFGKDGELIAAQPESRETNESAGGVWTQPRIVFGFVIIFLCLGVEAGLFGFFRNYLEQPGPFTFTSAQSQRLFTVYFAMFALGRLIASRIQKRVQPARQMAVHLVGAIGCLLLIIFGNGVSAIAGLLVLGFFVSIFFPTLYAIATEGAGELTAKASGLLTLGFLGCAILPILQGKLADSWGLPRSYLLGLVVYPLALVYVLGLDSRRKRPQTPLS